MISSKTMSVISMALFNESISSSSLIAAIYSMILDVFTQLTSVKLSFNVEKLEVF